MKVKHLKEIIKDWNPNDDIVFCEYSFGSEAYTKVTDVMIKHCRPKKKSYWHVDCANHELVKIRNSEVSYCNKWDSVLEFPRSRCFDCFKHPDNGIVYCLNCDSCNRNYTCRGLKE